MKTKNESNTLGLITAIDATVSDLREKLGPLLAEEIETENAPCEKPESGLARVLYKTLENVADLYNRLDLPLHGKLDYDGEVITVKEFKAEDAK